MTTEANTQAKGPPTDEEIGRRLSALPEEVALDWFWLMSRERSNRLALLELMALRVTIRRPSSWNPSDVRREHKAKQGGRYGDSPYVTLSYAEGCFVCRQGDDLIPHHIIQIQHGGSNYLRNRVVLCRRCHHRLHPWMKQAPAGRGGAMQSLAEIVESADEDVIDAESCDPDEEH